MTISVTTSSNPPSADLFLTGLPSGTTRVRVWRMWSDQEQRVRGDEQAAIISLETRLEDYDFPVGRAVSYRAQCFAIDGSELAPLAATTPVTVTLVDKSTAWVSDPLAPGLAQLLLMDSASDRGRTYESETVFARVMGSRRPTSISGARSSAGDWGFTFRANDFETADSIEALVSGGGTLLIRTHVDAVRHATGLIYLSAPQVTETPRHDIVAPHPNRSDWSIAGQESVPPSVSVVMPLRQYSDMEDENTDYQGVVDDYTDYLALLRG